MGRHHIKLPDHLYLSPPSPQPSSASSFFSLRSGLTYSSASFLSQTASTTRAIERRIPGFKTSAAFLTALRANIDLELEVSESPADTPDCLRPIGLTSASYLPPPSPLIHAMSNSNHDIDADFAPPAALKLTTVNSLQREDGEIESPESTDPNGLPELRTFPANDDALRVEALRLVADSVAQQRQRASRVLIFHPLTILALAVVFGLLRQFFYKGQNSDYALIFTTFAGVLMTLLVAIRAQTGAYIEEAERVGTWNWLSLGRSQSAQEAQGIKVLGEHEDEILLTKFGDEYIGTIIFRGMQPVDEINTKRSSRKNSSSQPKTEIRAWTVRQRYRGKGVGTALLEDAIKLAHERGWAQGGIDVARDHANSKVVLPKIFSGFVQENDETVRRYVERKVREYEDANTNTKGKKKN